jgi:hypothetical protein
MLSRKMMLINGMKKATDFFIVEVLVIKYRGRIVQKSTKGNCLMKEGWKD